MYPGPVLDIMQGLSLVEQQLISHAVQVHMLKHGGIAARGYCVAFPQNINEPAQILSDLLQQIQIIPVRKQGKNDTTKDLNVRRSVIQKVIEWLKQHNSAYSDIIISQERIDHLPENAPIDIHYVETKVPYNLHTDLGPAPLQVDPGEGDGNTVSCVTLPDPAINIREQVQKVVEQVVGEKHGPVTAGKKYVTIPWPTRGDVPLSEFKTTYFFTLGFLCLFPYGNGDFHTVRLRSFNSISDWAEHLIWYKEGRFANDQYFKFIVHNVMMRKRTLEQNTYIVRQQLGDEQFTLSRLKEQLEKGDISIAQKILYFGSCLRGTDQYWAQGSK